MITTVSDDHEGDEDELRCSPFRVCGDLKALAYRRGRLLTLGFSGSQADTLAEQADVDLHKAADLLCAGCPVDTAFEILAF